MVSPNLSFIPHIISDEEMAVMAAAFALSAEEKTAACCSVTHPLTFTRDGIDFVITQPENMGESISRCASSARCVASSSLSIGVLYGLVRQ